MYCKSCKKEFPVEDETLVGRKIECPCCGSVSRCKDRTLLVWCPQCGKEITCELRMLGGYGDCPHCGKNVLLTRNPTPEGTHQDSYLPPDYIIGNYTIIRCIGIGGMGEVYLVRHNLLKRMCALKLLHPAHSGIASVDSYKNLINEAQLACQLQSPHVITVLDAQINYQQNIGYIVMEYIEGNNLEELLNGQPMSEDYVLHVIRCVTLALVDAAALNVLHRDIKPANIMITREGEVKLADLGIARTKKAAGKKGTFTGTVHYASPEQLLGNNEEDGRSDIYSLGAVMYHMLSGKRPFEGNDLVNVMAKVMKGSFEPIRNAAPQVSQETCRLVSSMMSADADMRPANAEKLLDELDRIILHRSGKKPSLFSRIFHLEKKRILFVIAAALTLLLLIFSAILIFSGKKEKKSDIKAAPAPAAAQKAETPAPEPVPAPVPKEDLEPEVKPVPPVPRNTFVPSTKIDYLHLLILLAWIFSGPKVMIYLSSKKRKMHPFVLEYREYLNLGALFAAPIVYLIVEFNCRFYDTIRKMQDSKKARELPQLLDNSGKPIFQEESDSNDSEAVYYLKELLADALKLHASDIFLDPKNGEVCLVRFRVDGALRVIEEIDLEFGNKVINVIKVASSMNIAERRRPQDGAFALTGPSGNISLRTATVGVFNGEKVAMRILGDDSGPKNLADAGLKGKELLIMEQAAKLPSGMVLICGPTGSGKTTTLYAMLNSIDYNIKNVVSIEDPIEHVIPAISQMEVNEHAGITFAKLLRNALRQNPDIICLGEIRDEDTAQVAIHAAQTGHLIIATLHSNDNIGTIDRLANLNIPLRSIAGTLQLVVSQRLVRKLCSCKKHRAPTEEEAALFKRYDIECSKVFSPKGCPKCGDTGFSGRLALFDILTVDDDLRSALEDEHTNLSNIRKQLEHTSRGNAMIRSGCALVAKGITSPEELRRVTMEIKE